MRRYKGYIKPSRRKILVVEDLTLDAAIKLFTSMRDVIIVDYDNKEYTKEELKNVKNIRSLPGTGADSQFASGEPVSKDTDRELFSFNRDNTE